MCEVPTKGAQALQSSRRHCRCQPACQLASSRPAVQPPTWSSFSLSCRSASSGSKVGSGCGCDASSWPRRPPTCWRWRRLPGGVRAGVRPLRRRPPLSRLSAALLVGAAWWSCATGEPKLGGACSSSGCPAACPGGSCSACSAANTSSKEPTAGGNLGEGGATASAGAQSCGGGCSGCWASNCCCCCCWGGRRAAPMLHEPADSCRLLPPPPEDLGPARCSPAAVGAKAGPRGDAAAAPASRPLLPPALSSERPFGSSGSSACCGCRPCCRNTTGSTTGAGCWPSWPEAAAVTAAAGGSSSAGAAAAGLLRGVVAWLDCALHAAAAATNASSWKWQAKQGVSSEGGVQSEGRGSAPPHEHPAPGAHPQLHEVLANLGGALHRCPQQLARLQAGAGAQGRGLLIWRVGHLCEAGGRAGGRRAGGGRRAAAAAGRERQRRQGRPGRSEADLRAPECHLRPAGGWWRAGLVWGEGCQRVTAAGPPAVSVERIQGVVRSGQRSG